MKKVAIMQPYFLPYIGYFSLINAVDEFVVYDAIEFTKKGWINRNRYLANGEPKIFSLPLKKDSDYLFIKNRFLSSDYEKFRVKFLRQMEGAYKKSPYYEVGYSILVKCLSFEGDNLFDFIYNSIVVINDYLGIDTKLTLYSSLNPDLRLKSQDKVIEIVDCTGADIYINPIGGVNLYNKSHFLMHGVEIYFQKVNLTKYDQLDHEFVEGLSIIDLIFFNSVSEIKTMLDDVSYV